MQGGQISFFWRLLIAPSASSLFSFSSKWNIWTTRNLLISGDAILAKFGTNRLKMVQKPGNDFNSENFCKILSPLMVFVVCDAIFKSASRVKWHRYSMVLANRVAFLNFRVTLASHECANTSCLTWLMCFDAERQKKKTIFSKYTKVSCHIVANSATSIVRRNKLKVSQNSNYIRLQRKLLCYEINSVKARSSFSTVTCSYPLFASSVVDTKAKQAILPRRKHYWCCPFGLRRLENTLWQNFVDFAFLCLTCVRIRLAWRRMTWLGIPQGWLNLMFFDFN